MRKPRTEAWARSRDLGAGATAAVAPRIWSVAELTAQPYSEDDDLVDPNDVASDSD